MKYLSVVFLCLVCSLTQAQTKSFVIYNWDELPAQYDTDTILGLNMSKMKMDTFPEALQYFTNLQYLDLSKNKLTELPNFIGKLVNVTELNLEKNKFDKMPIELCRMKGLERIILNRNFLTTLPSCVEYLTNLKYIDLYDNPIGSLPVSFERMQSLEKMDLSGIRFSPDFQEKWKQLLPNVEFTFDEACDCMK